MNLDTAVSRRLREALLDAARSDAAGRIEDPEALSPEQAATLDRVGPIIETLYLMMVVDYDSALAEHEALTGALATLTGGALGASVLDWLIVNFERALDQQGREERLHQIGGQLAADRDDAELAFALAVAVAIADDRIDPAESEFVHEIGEWFGISPKRREIILQEAD